MFYLFLVAFFKEYLVLGGCLFPGIRRVGIGRFKFFQFRCVHGETAFHRLERSDGIGKERVVFLFVPVAEIEFASQVFIFGSGSFARRYFDRFILEQGNLYALGFHINDALRNGKKYGAVPSGKYGELGSPYSGDHAVGPDYRGTSGGPVQFVGNASGGCRKNRSAVGSGSGARIGKD